MAPAFSECSRTSFHEIAEFLLHRFGSIDCFNSMQFVDFVKIYNIAKEKEQREELYMAWVSCLPHMDKESFIPFEEYLNKCTGRDIDRRSNEEIMAEVEEIRRKVKENGNVTV